MHSIHGIYHLQITIICCLLGDSIKYIHKIQKMFLHFVQCIKQNIRGKSHMILDLPRFC